MNNLRIFLLDTETTGIDINNGDQMIELGIVEMDATGFKNSYLFRYRPIKPIEIGAQNIHQTSFFDLIDSPSFDIDAANTIRNILQNEIVVIHNASFDVNVLNSEFKTVGQIFYEPEDSGNVTSKIIDTLKVARQQFPSLKNNLDALCDRFNIDRNNRVFHGALIDCYLLGEVFNGLLPNFFNDNSNQDSLMSMEQEAFVLDCDFEPLIPQ